MRKKILTVIIVILALIVAGTGIKLFTLYHELNSEKQVLEEVKVEKEKQEKEEKPFKAKGDMVGWIKVPGTFIDYPVMYTPEQPEKYLHLDVKGEYSYSGTPFIDGNCTLESDNIIIYGHNMLNKTMFSTLDKYASYEFWEKHKTFTFETEDGKTKYKVIAAIKTDLEVGQDLYSFVDGSDESFDNFQNLVRSVSLYDTGFKNSQRQLVMLSTCAYHTDNGRFIVIGRKMKNQ